tara:strand:+ start:643 stop:1401 length:759 start_codon:yes stop_codon:yes gene_type:complete
MSAAFFQKLKAGAKNMEQDVTGPEYRYQDHIKTPSEMSMSDAGNFTALANNVAGLINYSKILTSGSGPARIGGPLGNTFFLKTAGKCAPASRTGRSCNPRRACPGDQECYQGRCWRKTRAGLKADRYLFFDNTTKGDIPFIRGKSSFKGLVPGMIENITEMNPLGILTAFAQDATPLCKKITRKHKASYYKGDGKTLGYRNSTRTHYVALGDIPEGFANRLNLSNKPVLNTYTTGFGFLLIYILYCIMEKNK